MKKTQISKNVILKIVFFDTDYTSCTMQATNRALQPRNRKLEKLVTERRDFLKIVGNEMVHFYFQEIIDIDVFWSLEKGIDKLVGGSYDIPEWGLKNLSVGEVLLEAWKRVSAENVNKDKWKDYVKYLVKRKV